MHPIFLVAQREFLQRVRQKMFWVMLLLGPFFFLLILIVPIGLSMEKENTTEMVVVDESQLLEPYLYSSKQLHFITLQGTLKEIAQRAKRINADGIMWITHLDSGWQCKYYRLGLLGAQDPTVLQLTLQQRIQEYELDQRTQASLPRVSFAIGGSLSGAKTDETVGFAAGLFLAMLILVFLNQYSQMVLRGVVEEKQNRIAELILTSVKPTHFIIGKITGIASVSFLQMAIWFGSTALVSYSVYHHFQLERFSDANISHTLRTTMDMDQSMEMNALVRALSSLDYSGLLLGFFFYFIVGYLLFSALFAMIGIAAGSDSDAHQLAVPLALPLALPLILLQSIVDHPDSTLARVLSIFPFTSPTTMMIRLPLGVPTGELILSASVLFVTFFIVALGTAKVYRIGALMYGKKPSLGEIWKWALRS